MNATDRRISTLSIQVPITLALLALFPPSRGYGQAIDPSVVRGPYLQKLLADRVEVVWVTSGTESPGRVVFEDPGGDIVDVVAGELSCEAHTDEDVAAPLCHRVGRDDLTPGGEYVYSVFDEDRRVAGPVVFRTPPPAGQGIVQLAAIGDSGIDTDSQHLVADVMLASDPDAVLHGGDLDYRADPDRTIFRPYRELFSSRPFFPARGNHDNTYPFEELFFVPGEEERETTFYSFDFGSAHIVVLDTTVTFGPTDRPPGAEAAPFDEQISFLRADLERPRNTQWTIVVLHAPIFTIGPHAIDRDIIRKRNTLSPILQEYEVDLVLTADDHIYHRSHPILTGTESCPDLDNRPCDPESDLPLCYELRPLASENSVATGVPIYVVSGGGGQRLYARLDTSANECLHVPTDLTAAYAAAWHSTHLSISPARLEVEAVDFLGQSIDRFSLSRLRFLRGDLDFDGRLQISDAVSILNALFLGNAAPCLAAGDVDASGLVNVADAVYTLNFLFLGGPSPAAPYPDCGPIEAGTPFPCERTGC